MSYKHLKEEIYYNDLYDRLTVERCRLHEKIGLEVAEKQIAKDGFSGKEADTMRSWSKTVIEVSMYFLKGEEYLGKQETINQWIQRDKAKDEKVANAIEPKGVHCLSCGSTMHLESKDLHSKKDAEQVLFLFRCNKGCKIGRAFWEDRQEYIPKGRYCPKCSGQVSEEDVKKDGDVITTFYSCPSCGHKYSDVLDLTTKEPTPDPNYLADRARFCLSHEEGEKFRDAKFKMEGFSKTMGEIKEREDHKELYDAVAQIKKLPFGEVQKSLASVFEENSYTNLQFEPPQMDKTVNVNFTAIDSKSGRSEYDSTKELKKLINTTLEGTNWRLVQSSLNYRLGFLSGRVQGLSSEEDLKKLVQRKTEETN